MRGIANTACATWRSLQFEGYSCASIHNHLHPILASPRPASTSLASLCLASPCLASLWLHLSWPASHRWVARASQVISIDLQIWTSGEKACVSGRMHYMMEMLSDLTNVCLVNLTKLCNAAVHSFGISWLLQKEKVELAEECGELTCLHLLYIAIPVTKMQKYF